MYIQARKIGKKANDPYSAELLATPTCAIIQALSQSANTSAVTIPDTSAHSVFTLQYGINL
jgi:hypothetical protein